MSQAKPKPFNIPMERFPGSFPSAALPTFPRLHAATPSPAADQPRWLQSVDGDASPAPLSPTYICEVGKFIPHFFALLPYLYGRRAPQHTLAFSHKTMVW
jgi:hypothetical protein